MPSKPLKAIKAMFPSPSSWRIVRGDKVEVMVGRDKGKQAQVLRVIRDERFPRVFVQGINMVTRRIPAQHLDDRRIPGFSVRMEAPIHYSNVMLVDPQSQKPVRSYFVYEDQPPYRRVRKTRGKFATDCVVPWPEEWKKDLEPSNLVGEKDTRPEAVDEVTYDPKNDFNLVLPSAHRRLKEYRELRKAEAAAETVAERQKRQQHRALLFAEQAAADSSTSSRRGSKPASSSAGSSRRNFSTSRTSSSSTGHNTGPWGMGILQHSPLLSSRSIVSCISRQLGLLAHARNFSWCGLAAAPCTLL